MKVEVLSWQNDVGWNQTPKLVDPDLVLYFGGKKVFKSDEIYQELKDFFPKAHLLGCSTGGEIFGPEVFEDSLVAAAVKFRNTTIKVASATISDIKGSFSAGKSLGEALRKPDLSHIFVLSDGTNVNGSDLIKGIYSAIENTVIVTGGLAGDGADFKTTLVGLNAVPSEQIIAAIGFYGSSFKITYGSVGGWNAFGPQRLITKSKNNVLYELDGKPALDLYKLYLGDDASRLPGSALLFPLSIRPTEHSDHSIVRTIVGIDEQDKSMIFAGDIPAGYFAQLMRGDFNKLVDGATQAASLSLNNFPASSHSLAILVSCIGRKLLLNQRISEETEAVSEIYQNLVPMIGFYSYGEICHQQFTNKCSLHNQTMTTTLWQENE